MILYCLGFFLPQPTAELMDNSTSALSMWINLKLERDVFIRNDATWRLWKCAYCYVSNSVHTKADCRKIAEEIKPKCMETVLDKKKIKYIQKKHIPEDKALLGMVPLCLFLHSLFISVMTCWSYASHEKLFS